LIIADDWIKTLIRSVAAVVNLERGVASSALNPERRPTRNHGKGVGGPLGSRIQGFSPRRLTGIKFYGGDDNKNFFGTKESPARPLPTTRSPSELLVVATRRALCGVQRQAGRPPSNTNSFVNG